MTKIVLKENVKYVDSIGIDKISDINLEYHGASDLIEINRDCDVIFFSYKEALILKDMFNKLFDYYL